MIYRESKLAEKIKLAKRLAGIKDPKE
jgi:hypothetical protein